MESSPSNAAVHATSEIRHVDPGPTPSPVVAQVRAGVPVTTAGATATAPERAKGVCQIKSEFIRPPDAVLRVSLDSEQKTRGMNKGAQRETFSIEGTARPSFEGECNFLNGAVLSKVKAAIRRPKRERGEADAPSPQAPPPPPTPAVQTDGSAPPPPPQHQQQHQQPPQQPPFVATSAALSGELDGEEIRAGTKQRAAGWCEYEGISQDERRERQAKSRALFENRLIVAPLTTVGNLPFRRICTEFGADNTMSEVAMTFNLNKTQKSEWSLLRRHSSEKVFGLQIAVNRADDAAAFARALHAADFSYDYLDINCGCPVGFACDKGCGFSLWEKKGKLRDIVKAFSQFQSKPVTIKCRIGADEHNPTLHRVIGEYENWGTCAVTIHGRSKQQRYTKEANWRYIEECSHLTSLPVVGNGDVFSYQDILDRREIAPHVSSYMIGRGALIKPWIFEEIKEQKVYDISSRERLDILKRYSDYGLAHWGADERGVETTRRFMLEWLSFLHRYVPVGLLEVLPQRMNDRPPAYYGRDDLETLMASESVEDWIRISEMLLGPASPGFKFTPKHKSNAYASTVQSNVAEGAAAMTAAVEG